MNDIDDNDNPYICKHCTFINDDKNLDIIACEACDEILPYFMKSNSSNEGNNNNNNNNRKRKVSNLDSLQYLDSSSKVRDKNIISIICQVCTYNNEIRVSNISTEELKCEICKSKISSSKVNENAIKIVNCSNCTFENNIELKICEICNEPLPGYNIENSNNIKNNENNNNSNQNSSSNNNNNGILKYFNGQLSVNKFSSEVMTESEGFKSDSATDGIIPLLETALRKSGSSNYRLCLSFTHVSQTGVTEGCYWSCGYRNIQQLCTALMKNPSYKAKLFNGDGDIPDVNGLQAWIEKAWRAGFDIVGQQQLGGSLVGRDLWIGATECAALLRYFGLKAEIVDFSTHQDGSLNLGDRLISWIKIYYDYCKTNGGVILPLYFQHDGHSRTIVGYEYNDKKTSILIFDPISNGKTIKQKLINYINGVSNSGWQVMMKRGLHTMVKKDYQLVYVDEGIMSPELKELSKIINSSTDTESKKELSKLTSKTVNLV